MLYSSEGAIMYIVFSGVSACGKNTIMNELMKRRKDCKVLEFSSATTRPPRETDKQFNTYVYLSEDEFKRDIEANKFYEYEIIHGNYYGTILKRLNDVIDDPGCIYIRDIDVKGCAKLRQFFRGKTKFASIFLDAPDEVLRQRLIDRGSDNEDIEKRLSRSKLERSYKKDFDLVIENIDIDETIAKILDFIEHNFN